MAHTSRIGAFAGVLAAASMAFTPAQAAQPLQTGTMGYASAVHADFSQANPFDLGTFNGKAETAELRRRGFRGRRGFRRGRGRGGGIFAGILILGGIAAVAAAASNNRRRDRDVVVIERDRRDDDRRTDRRTNRSTNGSGLDNAVDQCLNEIERDVRVDGVDNASRNGSGWIVSGTLFNGSGFTCQIGNDGRISNIDYGDLSSNADGLLGNFAERSDDSQFADDRYADARASLDGQGDARLQNERQASLTPSSDPQPAYPGGPLPGEDLSDDIDGDLDG